MAHGPELWIPAGNWADWFGALFTAGAIALGVYTWTRDRRRTLYLEESEQARRVAAIFDVKTDPQGSPYLRATVINASDLPVIDVKAVASIEVSSGVYEQVLLDVPSLVPGQTKRHDESPGVLIITKDSWRFTLTFEDANGVRWRRNAGRPVERVP
ncbi:MAG TPA: hypothetical protein VMO88_02040 [Acidimicrobiales bacterium]|nr:hypothetical protein [Acidimicrobiales bacterium]